MIDYKILGRVKLSTLRYALLSCLVILLCASCTGERPAASLSNESEAQKFLQPQAVNERCDSAVEPEAYRLGSEDVLEITIYEESALSGDYTISQSGVIDMPLIGSVMVSGCSFKQVEKIIHDKYTDGYLIDPSISLEIKEYRPFYIIGEIRSPGQYNYSSDMTILKAVALAGGFTYRANKGKAEVLRHTAQNSQLYRTQSLEINVRPGDVIFIKERLF